MRFTSNWVDKGPSTVAVATRHGMCMVAVAALALGWATTAAAVPATGQTTCYKLERLGHLGANDKTYALGLGYVDDEEPIYRDPQCTGSIVAPGDGTISDCPTDCAGTGQDGEFQKGEALCYLDKGDGRILDQNTLLEWAKKSDDGSIHDKDNVYTWEEAFEYVKTLNNMCEEQQLVKHTDLTYSCAEKPNPDRFCKKQGLGKCGFAGKRDWRLPNVKELQSIGNYEVLFPGPTVHEVFNTNCVPGATVLTGSCAHADDLDNPTDQNRVPVGEGLRVGAYYWSSTSGDAPGDAWFWNASNGDTGAHTKDDALVIDTNDTEEHPLGKVIFAGHVRAVRGGKK